MKEPTLFDFINVSKSNLKDTVNNSKYLTTLNDKSKRRRKRRTRNNSLNDNISFFERIKLAFKNDPILKLLK